MHCLKCGKQLPEGNKFCQYCGEAVTQDPNADKESEKAAPRGKQKKWVVLSVFAAVIIAAFALCAILLGSEEAEKVLSPVVSEPTAAETAVPDESVSLSEAADLVLYLEVFDENDECIGTASGFLAVSDRTLITNYHVVEEAHRIVAWTSDAERSVEANTLLAYDEVADLAVLRCASGFGGAPLVLADSDETEQGETVYAVGYPLGIANTMSNGIVSARYMDEQGVDTIQMTAAISEGNSGGPLLNEEGQVIGVVCSYYVYGQNMNMAVASNTLKELLDETFEPIELKEWTNRPAMPGYEEEEPEEATPPTPVTSNRIDQVETVVRDSCKGYSASADKVLNGTLTFDVVSGTEVELYYNVDNLVPTDEEYLVDEVMDQILNYVIDDINEAGFPEVIDVYVTVNYEVPEETEPSEQAAAYSALYDWVEQNYTDTWTNDAISYWEEYSADDLRYDFDIIIDNDELVLRCEMTGSSSRDVVYLTLYPEGMQFPVDYYYYDTADAETAATTGFGYIDAPPFTMDSTLHFTSVEGSTVGIEYMEQIAAIASTAALWFADGVLCNYLTGGNYSIADFGFTSLS